ncbi:MAG: polysaccharide biosynthesis tyrosine autokinase [Bacteroidaceae bacterium]|nr:polysaccharide biosynthesis tyrosine autokinase [Bacteroidaceae bacterium]
MSDKVNFDLEDLDDLKDFIGDERKGHNFDFQKVFAHLVLNWQWYLLSLVICLGCAFLYLRYALPIYQVSARMLVKDEDKKTGSPVKQMIPNMEDFGIMNYSNGFDNEVEILQSPVTVHDAVKRLKLYTEYRQEGRVKDRLIYLNQPVLVDLDPMSLDSLDYYMLEGVHSIQLAITKKGESYHADIALFTNGKRWKEEYSEDIDSLGTSIKTHFGTISFMSNPKYKKNIGNPVEKEATLLVTIRPPMVVALDYMRRLSVEPTSKKTSIAAITLSDENVSRGIDFINALVLCYNDQANMDKNEIALKTEEFINQRLEKIDAELGTTESSLENYKRRNAVTQLEADAAQSLQLSAQYATRLADANTQLQLIDYLRQYVENPENRYKVIPANIGMEDRSSAQLISEYNLKALDRTRMMRSANEQSPQVQMLSATLDDLASSIKLALSQAHHSAEMQRSTIKNEYTRYQGRIGNTPEQERVLTQIGRQQEVRSGLYLLLLQKREENSISLAATADKGKLIAMPLPQGTVSPRKGFILITSLLLGLLIPFAILFVRELLRYRIEGREDVVSLTKVPIVADVPVASEKVKTAAGIVVQADKNSQMDEVFRSLRTNVQFMMKENEKIILFTSGTSGEGKTFLAANLAVSFALLGKRVILVGCDIRKPALGRLFGRSNQKQGLTNLLREEHVTAEDLHKETFNYQLPNQDSQLSIDLLLSGPIPPNPTEMLSRTNLKTVLDLMSEEYDYIILDTAPVGLVTDTLLLAHYANVSCFVCRADYTPKANIELLNSLTQDKKLPNVCVVLNAVDMSKRKYGYYYGYGRYGKYGKYGYGKHGYGRYGYGNYGSYGNYADSRYSNKDDDSIKK